MKILTERVRERQVINTQKTDTIERKDKATLGAENEEHKKIGNKKQKEGETIERHCMCLC